MYIDRSVRRSAGTDADQLPRLLPHNPVSMSATWHGRPSHVQIYRETCSITRSGVAFMRKNALILPTAIAKFCPVTGLRKSASRTYSPPYLYPYPERQPQGSVHSTRTELSWTDLNKSTQLHDAFIGNARRRHDYTSHWLAGAKLGRLMLG